MVFPYISFIGVDGVSLHVTSLLYVHGFVMMSPLLKAILTFCTTKYLGLQNRKQAKLNRK